LGGVAMISLIVGGIGVMNLLLLSVTQRTREVGLRMALGARKRDIAAQFVSEATMISLAGGVLGLLAGLFASSMLEGVLQWSTTISPLTMVLALVVAAALGIIAGVYPAQRAAGLDPIGALRFECAARTQRGGRVMRVRGWLAVLLAVGLNAAAVAHEGEEHGDHDARHGGFVMMYGDLHFELVAKAAGAVELYYSDAVRAPLPAATASDVVVEIERTDGSIENVAMAIS